MSEIKISLDNTGPGNEISAIRVDGVIDTMTATELEKVINSLLEQERYYIIIDLAGVDYISSAGWGIFISHIREIRQQGGDIKLVRMIPNVHEIFELLEFDSILKAFGSLEEARMDFKHIDRQSRSAFLKQPEPVTAGNTNAERNRDIDKNRPAGASSTYDSESANFELDEDLPEPETDPSKMTLDQKIRRIIIKDPFLDIGGIKEKLRSDEYGEKSIKWWSVFKWLYSNNLISKSSRLDLSNRLK